MLAECLIVHCLVVQDATQKLGDQLSSLGC